jgi:uncharacterized protein (UPF0261 family)
MKPGKKSKYSRTLMRPKSKPFTTSASSPRVKALNLGPLYTVAVLLTCTSGLQAADDVAAQRLLSQARAKETQAQELRAAAAAAVQKATDDQMEASADDREARILSAQALKMLGADANKQKAFRFRQEARKLWVDAHNMAISARNAQTRAAQQTHNAQELQKSAAELKDQPTIAGALEAEAKEQMTEAQKSTETAAQEKFGVQSLDDRAKAAWAEAEKLDPETHRQVAPAPPKAVVTEARPAR